MNKPKPSQLFKAAKTGDIDRIRELLAAGISLEEQDMDKATPLMRAAQAGKAAAFHFLVEAGANLNHLALDQTDLLEMAAEGGNVEILQFLIDRKMPLEGHWKPRGDAERRQGHITPLMNAALAGHLDAVRLLLDAGADPHAKFDGRTPLLHAKAMSSLAKFNENLEEVKKYQEVIAFLSKQSKKAEPPKETHAPEVATFAANARQPAYLEIRKKLVDLCGEPKRWKPIPDHGIPAAEVVVFTLPKSEKGMAKLQDEVHQAGFHLVLSEAWMPGEKAKLVLFPTNDTYAVIAAVGTEGANYEIQTEDIIVWLKEMEKDNPFTLRICGHDSVSGDFLAKVKNAKKLAEKMAEFCPSCLDDDFESPEELARALSRHKSFYLRWD